ncbi:MAG: ABC transporter substrate-binding protein [Acidimicrobiia bacterium]|nr:ABC transporter substrate-binding protein [Acidimicrobiia bacterium]
MSGVERRQWRTTIGGLLVVCALIATACSGAADENPPIVIGSFDFPESEALGEVFRLALEAEGFPVVHRARIGDRAEVNALMRAGEVDLVPEYLGSALEVTFGVEPSNDIAESFRLLSNAWLEDGFIVLLPSPAQSQNGFAMTEANAGMLDVALLSDLAAIAGDLTFGGPPECPQRPRCLVGLAETYGIEFRSVVTLDAGGPATIQALQDGTIDVGLVFTTDPAVEDGDLMLLGDDLGLQPNESIVPVLSLDAANRSGDELAALLDEISTALEQRAVVALNRAVASGRSPGDAAEEWLLVNGFDS